MADCTPPKADAVRPNRKEEALGRAADMIRARYGDSAVDGFVEGVRALEARAAMARFYTEREQAAVAAERTAPPAIVEPPSAELEEAKCLLARLRERRIDRPTVERVFPPSRTRRGFRG